MKQLEQPEMDAYRIYLQGHLRDHHFPQSKDKKFIEARVNAAYKTYTDSVLAGRSPYIAQELAMRTLLDGYYVSRWDVVYNTLDETFHGELPTERQKKQWTQFLLELRFINAILNKYEVDGDFLSREKYSQLQNELTGEIAEIIEKMRNVLQ